MDKEYQKAIEKAEKNLADARERGDEAIGGNFLELINSFLTPEELEECEIELAKIKEEIYSKRQKIAV